MGKYLKLFDNHNGYTAYTADTENYLLPNVSYCIEQDECHFNPYNEPSQGLVLATTYNVEDASEPIVLYYYYVEEGKEEWWIRGIDMFDKVEIDGVEVNVADLDADGGTYNLAVGTHTVNYTLKDGNTGIHSSTFEECYALSSVNIPSGVTSIGEYAFSTCGALTSIDIPNSVTYIGEGAFENCRSLRSINIPSGVTSIGGSAFYGCSSLTSINIPSGVTSIGVYAFDYCVNLSSITVDARNDVYDSRNNCNAIIETSTNALIQGCNNTIIPSGVTSIGLYAFADCSGLTSITIPSSVTSIGLYAFAECSGLTSVAFESGSQLTSIVEFAFSNCESLTSIIIPSGVTSIGQYAFKSNMSITCLPTTPPILGRNAFGGYAYVICVPSGYIDAYKTETSWSTYARYITDCSTPS